MTKLDLLEKNEAELGIENISTITNEASKSFKIALDILSNDKNVNSLINLKTNLKTNELLIIWFKKDLIQNF